MAAHRLRITHLVILWSLTCPAVVSGQSTFTGCGVDQHCDRAWFAKDDESRYQSELDVVKLQLQLMAEKLGVL